MFHFCDFTGHQYSVCRKKKKYKEDVAAKRRMIKKTEDGEEQEDPSDDEASDVEEDAVHIMEEYFQEPTEDKGECMSFCREQW